MNDKPSPLTAARSTRRSFLTGVGAAAIVSSSSLMRGAWAQAARLKVGVLLPKSGVQAFFGQSCQFGADVAPAVIKSMLGVDIELMNADTESNVDTARSRAERLISEGAHVLTGPFDSGAAQAIAQVAEQRGVPFMINIAAAPQITEQGYRFTFRNFPTSVDLVRNGLALIRDLFQATRTAPRTAVFMHVNDTFGEANRKAIQAILPKLDYLPFKIVETIAYDPAAKDLTVEVARAKASKADFLLLVCRLNDSIILRREMVKQRWNPMGIIGPGNPGMYEKQYYTALGKLSEYSISNVPWYNPKADLTKAVDAQMKKQFPKERLMFHALNVGFTFEAVMVVADAYRRAKSANPKALAEAIRRTNLDKRMMLGGPIRFNAKGQVEGINSAAIQNLNMRPTVVLPANAAEAKPIFPMPGYGRA
ncbi:MAG: branched-chain amino acid ABC transporter [Betaproteobacteria bacterium RIFCSPLOWO2_02_FULL_65_24]|nr:MAG: branched-chain amino acid ABC transporter [Betaproteobacteria bacterium RIFCSPLOWO2_02_FULL_65_24]